jgi:hypothetical protein
MESFSVLAERYALLGANLHTGLATTTIMLVRDANHNKKL